MVADVIRLRRLFDAEQIEKLTLVSRRALAAAISSQGVIGQTETSVILISLGPHAGSMVNGGWPVHVLPRTRSNTAARSLHSAPADQKSHRPEMNHTVPMCSRHGAACSQCPHALVCVAGRLSAARSQEIGISLSRHLGMRVYTDNCFIKCLQDGYLVENADRRALDALFAGRGRGASTPFSPMPMIIVLLRVQVAETRKNLLTKSCQTGPEEVPGQASSSIPARYIENLTRAYCEHIRGMASECTVADISVDELLTEAASVTKALSDSLSAGALIAEKAACTAQSLAAAPAEKTMVVSALASVGSPPVSPPYAQALVSPTLSATWKRLNSISDLSLAA
jgi:hypothetical protein